MLTTWAIDDEQYHQLNVSLAKYHVIPRYEKLVTALAQLNSTAQDFCKTPEETTLRLLEQEYHSAMDKWMEIQHIRFGPISKDSRFFKIQFWPDDRGIVRKHLRRFIGKMEKEEVSLSDLQSGSVAIQGFPAVEQLIFNKRTPLLPQNQKFQLHCQLLQWITSNLHEVAQDILTDWKSEKGYQTVVETASEGNFDFLSAKEVSYEFLMSLQTELQLIDDAKLLAPLGKKEKKARPNKSESWRSQRSLRNIIHNFKGLRQLYEGESQSGFDDLIQPNNPDLARQFQQQFEIVIQTAQTLEIPLSQAVSDPLHRAPVVQLRQEVKQLRELVEKQLTTAIDISLGFNALDGD